MKSILYLTALQSLFFFSTQLMMAQAGNLDLSFGEEGTVLLDSEWKGNFKIQPDGKLLIGGTRKVNGSNSKTDWVIGRLSQDGSPDASFGNNGETILDFADLPMASGNYETYHSLIMLNDGRIVACGLKGSYSTGSRQIIAAVLRPNGEPDSSFGQVGKRLFNLEGFRLQLAGTERFSNNDFLLWAVMGVDSTAEYSHIALIRFRANGSLDSSFGTNGDGMLIKEVGPVSPFGGTLGRAWLKISPDDKIILCGTTGVYEMVTNRFNLDGSDDLNFGTNGQALTYVGLNTQIADLAIQPDGKIVAFGYSYFAGEPVFTIMRLDVDGQNDPQWDEDGVLIRDIGDYDNSINAGVVQGDGKILAAGCRVFADGSKQWVVARFNKDGSFDNTFGLDGIQANDFGEGTESPLRMAISQDHAIYVSGLLSENGGPPMWMMVKYLAEEYVSTHILTDNEILKASLSPNPASPGQSVILRYQLENPDFVSAQLIDSKGSTVQVFFSDEERVTGEHSQSLRLNEHLPSGVYRLILKTSHSQTALPVLLKR